MVIFTRRTTQNGRWGSPPRSVRAVFMAFLPEVARATVYKKSFSSKGWRPLSSVASTFNKLRKEGNRSTRKKFIKTSGNSGNPPAHTHLHRRSAVPFYEVTAKYTARRPRVLPPVSMTLTTRRA
jgi:hypothetical protein